MDSLIVMLIIFVLTFMFRLLIYIISKKRKKKKNGISTEMKYLVNKFKLNKKKVDKTSIASIISLLDALIISGTVGIVTVITKNITLQLLIGLVFVLVFIFCIYEIFGRVLIKKGYDLK